MKHFPKFVIPLILLATVLVAQTLPRAGIPQTATLVSWNMKWFPAGFMDPQPEDKEQNRIEKAASYISRHAPDIMAIQEIRDSATCEKLVKAMKRSDLKVAVCSEFELEPGRQATQQVAILSKYTSVEAGFERWRTVDYVTPPRGYAYAVLDIGGKRVCVFSLHLKSNFIPNEAQNPDNIATLNRLKRELSTQQIAAKMTALDAKYKKANTPISAFVVAGDFNTSLFDDKYTNEKTIRALLANGMSDAFAGIAEDKRHTLPESEYYPPAIFDYVLYRGLDIRSANVLPPHWISDHNMLVVKFDITK